MRAYEFIIENDFLLDGRKRIRGYSDEDILKVIDAYDKGLSYSEIGDLVGLIKSDVNSILNQNYPNRKRRSERFMGALTDSDKQQIVYSFIDGESLYSIADDLGVSLSLVKVILRDNIGQEELDQELERRRTLPNVLIPFKVTPETIAIMRAEYVTGKGSQQIADMIGNISHSTVDYHLRKQPDWPELRAKWEERRKDVKHSGPATTKKNRAGEPGNQHQRGPGDRRSSGVDWGRSHR